MDEYVKLLHLLKSFGYDPKEKDIEKCEKGYQNRVYIFKSENLAIKIIDKNEMGSKNETRALSIIKDNLNNFPAPEVLKSDDTRSIIPNIYVIMNLISGQTLDDSFSELENKNKFFVNLGELLGRLHNIKNSYYGDLFGNIKEKTWLEYKEKEFAKLVKKIKFEDIDLDKIISFWEKNKSVLDTDTGPCLVHGDITFSNIIIEDNSINGLIDYEHSMWGAGLCDFFSSIRSFKFMWENSENILEGYSKYQDVSRNWKKLMFFYQWFANLKRISSIEKMSWRDLDESEQAKRKNIILERCLSKLYKIQEEYDDNDTC